MRDSDWLRVQVWKHIVNLAMKTFQVPVAGALLVWVFSVGELMLLLAPLQRSGEVETALVVLGLVIVLWLFFARAQIDARLALGAFSWSVLLIHERVLLGDFMARIDWGRASLASRSFAIGHGAILLLISLIPLIFLSGPGRVWGRKVSRILQRLPAWVYILVLALGCFAAVASHWPGRDTFRVDMIARSVGSLVILGIASIAMRRVQGQGTTTYPTLPDLSPFTYHVLYGVLLVTYLALAARAAALQLENVDDDGVAYMQVALRYASGEFPVRGHWSPLISWLTAVPISLGAEPLIGARAVGVLSGLAWIICVEALARRFSLPNRSRLGLVACLLATALANSVVPFTADLLGSIIITGSILVLMRGGVLRRPIRSGLAAGSLGAIGYFAKYYNLPAFLLILLAGTLLQAITFRPIRRALVVGGAALVALAVVALPWVALLSLRYGYLTYSLSGSINQALIAPGANYQYVCLDQRPCALPTDVLFPWEDPLPNLFSGYGSMPDGGLSSLRQQLAVIHSSIRQVFGTVAFGIGPLPPLATVGLAGALIFLRDPRRRFPLAFLVTAILLYPTGYVLVHGIESRYYLPVVGWMLIATYIGMEWLLPAIYGQRAGPHAPRGALALAITLAFAPLVSVIQLDKLRGILTIPFNACMKDAALEMSPYLEAPFVGTGWQVNTISFFSQRQTYGALLSVLTPSEADAELRGLGVRTYLLPTDDEFRKSLTESYGYRETHRSSICGHQFSLLEVPDG